MDVYLGPGKRRDVLLLSSPTWTLDSLLPPIFHPAWSSPQSSLCERKPGNHWDKLVLSWVSHDEIPTIKFSQKRVKHWWHLVPDPIRCAFKSVNFSRSAIQARSVDGPWTLDSLERLSWQISFLNQLSNSDLSASNGLSSCLGTWGVPLSPQHMGPDTPRSSASSPCPTSWSACNSSWTPWGWPSSTCRSAFWSKPGRPPQSWTCKLPPVF